MNKHEGDEKRNIESRTVASLSLSLSLSLTISRFFLSMEIASLMILDAVRELVLRMRDIVKLVTVFLLLVSV